MSTLNKQEFKDVGGNPEISVVMSVYQDPKEFLIQKEIDFDKFNSKDAEKYLSILNQREKSHVCYMTSKIILRSDIAESLDYCKDSIRYYKYNLNTYLLFCYILVNMLFRKV